MAGMAEYGDDWTGGFDDPANVQLDSVQKMLEMQQSWLDSGFAEVSPDGHVDLEAGFQNILDHNIVSFPKALWYMSRFTNYMPEESGNWYIAKCPVFEAGQKCSVGIGGTGTVVTQQSANTDLAAEFLCWAKMSDEGEKNIWDTLGFDVCNTACWTDDAFAHDDMWEKENLTVIWPLYIPTTRILTFHIRRKKPYLGGQDVPLSDSDRRTSEKSAIVTTESGMVDVVTMDFPAVI